MNVSLATPLVSNWTHQFIRTASGTVQNIVLAVPSNLYRRKIYFYTKSSSASYFIEGELYAAQGGIDVFQFPFRIQAGGTLNQVMPSYTFQGTITDAPEALNQADVDGAALLPFTIMAVCDEIGVRIKNQTAGQSVPRIFLGVRSLARF